MLTKPDPAEQGVALGTERGRRDNAEYLRLDRALDEGLMETFPASDAVMIVQPVPERRKMGVRYRG
ncbi:MAG TPA: hypothetical protein VNL39_04080 [Xanthobacteraceae bacterium]|nr:hypothetical protein [Xanthobacteraceae bacterium]